MSHAEYDQFSETFARSRKSMEWPEVDALVETFRKNFRVDEGGRPKILDVGCGSGRLVPVLERAFPGGFDYLGTDVSVGMLREAKKAHSEYRFEKADMRELADNAIVRGKKPFDAVFAIASFHHLLAERDQLEALSGFRNLLVPGGFLAMTCWNLLSVSNMAKYGDRQNSEGIFEIKIGANVRHYAGLDEKTLRKLLLEAGFEKNATSAGERNFAVWGFRD
jgi:trans-aconitate methyltransferase